MTAVNDRPVRDAIVGYIRDNFLYTRPDYRLGDDAPLIDDGIVDSMGAVELVTFLQERFAITIPDDEITEENFGTVAAITAYVHRKHLASP